MRISYRYIYLYVFLDLYKNVFKKLCVWLYDYFLGFGVCIFILCLSCGNLKWG